MFVPAEHRAAGVLAAGDGAEEQRLLGGRGGSHLVVASVGVPLRGLHEADIGIVEVPERSLEEVWRRDVVAVEDDDVRRAHVLQRVVDVAGLGAHVDRAADVPDPEAAGQRLHRG